MHACSQFFMRTCMEVSAKDHLISVFLHVLIDLYRSINHFKQTKKKKKGQSCMCMLYVQTYVRITWRS